MILPKKIYLQVHEDDGSLATWSEDRVENNDVEYYHQSEIERLKKALGRVHYYSHVNCAAVNEIVDEALKEN